MCIVAQLCFWYCANHFTYSLLKYISRIEELLLLFLILFIIITLSTFFGLDLLYHFYFLETEFQITNLVFCLF